jgi:hypothetical protein
LELRISLKDLRLAGLPKNPLDTYHILLLLSQRLNQPLLPWLTYSEILITPQMAFSLLLNGEVHPSLSADKAAPLKVCPR